MTKLSSFHGITISISYANNCPIQIPHIHAEIEGRSLEIGIENGLVLSQGEINRQNLGKILKWVDIHRNELHTAWSDAKSGKVPDQIKPLP